MAPTQALEPAEVPVGGDPFAACLDRQRGVVGIGHQVALHARLAAEPPKDLPMTLARGENHRIRLAPNRIDEAERPLDRCGRHEDSRMGGDTEEAAQDEIGDAHRLVTREHLGEPILVALVIRRALMKCIDRDVDVYEDGRSNPSMMSRRPAVSSRSTPGAKRLLANVGSTILFG